MRLIREGNLAHQITFLQLEALVALADMASRSARLTVDGREVLTQARTILQQRDVLLSQYASEKVLRRSLRLGVTELAALTWLPGFIDALRSTYPLVEVQLEVGGVAADLYEKLRLAQLDLALVPDTPRWTDMLRFPLANVRNGWYCSPTFNLKRRRLGVSELGQLTLLSQSADSVVGHVMSKWLEHNGVQPRSILTCNSFAALGGMASAGLGIACLPNAISGELVTLGMVREVHVVPAMPPVRYVAVARHDALTPFHRKVIALARTTCNYGTRYQDAHAGNPPANEAE
jgi:DNA-binding transcriptional LysR family regulator